MTDDVTTLPALTPEMRRRSFRYIMIGSVFAITDGQIFAINIIQLIVWELGGREQMIGLLGFLMPISNFAQLLIITVAQRMSKKTFLYRSFGIACVLSWPIFFLQDVSQRWGVTVALGVLAICATGRTLFMAMSTPSWMGLVRESMEESQRGRLLGLLRTTWQSAGVLTVLITGIFLGIGSGAAWWKLQWVMVAGYLAQVGRLLTLIPVASAPVNPNAPVMPWRQQVLEPIRDRAYRAYLTYVLLFGLGVGLSETFRLTYLIRIGFEKGQTLIAICFAGVGAVITLLFWGRLADRFGNRPVFTVTAIGMALASVLWLFVGHSSAGFVVAMALFLLAGACNSGNGVGQTRYMFSAIKPEFEASYVAANYLTLALAISLGSLIGGQILGLAHETDPLTGADTDQISRMGYHIVFMLGAALLLVALLFRRGFREAEDVSTRDVLRRLARPFWPAGNTPSPD